MATEPVPVVGVSLKLYLDLAATLSWVRAVAEIATASDAVRSGAVDLVVFPSVTAIPDTVRELQGTRVAVGAQDVHWVDRGAFTGAVSGADLAALGCRYVEVGHAERRRLFGEVDGTVRAKLGAAVRNRLTPFLCVGEPTRTDPRAAARFCAEQVGALLNGFAAPDGAAEVVVAYEPVWAIGQAEPAPAEHVREVCAAIRDRLDELSIRGRVIYGGSAAPGTLTRLRRSVDGVFLGRFAHDPANLSGVINEAVAIL